MELHKNYIAGEWVEGASVNQNINPSDTNEIVGLYARADAAQTEQAVQAAKETLPKWKNVTVHERSEIIDRIGTEILDRKGELECCCPGRKASRCARQPGRSSVRNVV